MSKNDDKILQLKKQIEEKKKRYAAKKRFNPITSCILTLNGKNINLHTINNINDLNQLLIMLNIFRLSAIDLGFNENAYVIDGFGIKDWMSDVEQKIEVLRFNMEEKLLVMKEKQLDKLLSEDKKTELELLEIEKMLND